MGNETNVNNIYKSIKNHINNNKIIFILFFGIYFTYTVINYLILLVRYISMPILFAIIMLKIGIYSLSTNSDDDNVYSSIILRQSFIIMLIQLIISILNIIETIPIVNIFSLFNYISFLLIILSYIVILPVGITNILFKKLTSKIYFLNNEILLDKPLSDKIILWIKNYVGSHINIINKCRYMINNYENKDINEKDMSKLTDILDIINKYNLRLTEYYNYENIIKLCNETKIELKKLTAYIIKLIAVNTN